MDGHNIIVLFMDGWMDVVYSGRSSDRFLEIQNLFIRAKVQWHSRFVSFLTLTQWRAEGVRRPRASSRDRPTVQLSNCVNINLGVND